jgi:glucosamine 6-phosphate synthetase-like amidotransferase/phosphosugar isomerase protein
MRNNVSSISKKKLREVIMTEIVEQNDVLTDDLLVEAMESYEQVESAIDQIIEYLQVVKEIGL